MPTLTVNPAHLGACVHFAHKEKTRYAMNGVAINAEGQCAATDGKAAIRISGNDPFGEPLAIICSRSVKDILRMAKGRARDPERLILVTVPEGYDGEGPVAVNVTEDTSGKNIGSLTADTIIGHFPPLDDVYDPPSGGSADTRGDPFGVNLEIFARAVKAQKILGAQLTEMRCPSEPQKQAFRMAIGPARILVMPLG